MKLNKNSSICLSFCCNRYITYSVELNQFRFVTRKRWLIIPLIVIMISIYDHWTPWVLQFNWKSFLHSLCISKGVFRWEYLFGFISVISQLRHPLCDAAKRFHYWYGNTSKGQIWWLVAICLVEFQSPLSPWAAVGRCTTCRTNNRKDSKRSEICLYFSKKKNIFGT